MTKPKHRGAWQNSATPKREANDPQIVAGRFRLTSRIAKGGMGEVWVAYDKTLGREVAIKLVRFGSTIDDAKARFDREVALSRQLRGPAFVEVFAHGADDERAFVAMELLVGETLQERLKRVGAMSTDEALDFLNGVGAALRVAHSLMVVHRDLKPSNIFFARVLPSSSGARPKDGRDEIVKLLDFGIAKDAWDDARLTRPGVVMGSAHYMSPEQIRSGADVDVRSDLFSLGVLLYRALTGERPFEGSAAEALAGILSDEPRRATRVKASLPAKLDAFFAKALAKEPSRRFQTVDELIEAFSNSLDARHDPRRPSTGWIDPATWLRDGDSSPTHDTDARETVLEKPVEPGKMAGATPPTGLAEARLPKTVRPAPSARHSLDSGMLEEFLPIVEPRRTPPPLPARPLPEAVSAPRGEAVSTPPIASREALLPVVSPPPSFSTSRASRPISAPSLWVARSNEVTARRRVKRSRVVEIAIVAIVAAMLVLAWRYGIALGPR